MIEVYCWGEPLAGFYSKNPNALGKPGEFRMTWGGDTSNVALAVKKLGHNSFRLYNKNRRRFSRAGPV